MRRNAREPAPPQQPATAHLVEAAPAAIQAPSALASGRAPAPRHAAPPALEMPAWRRLRGRGRWRCPRQALGRVGPAVQRRRGGRRGRHARRPGQGLSGRSSLLHRRCQGGGAWLCLRSRHRCSVLCGWYGRRLCFVLGCSGRLHLRGARRRCRRRAGAVCSRLLRWQLRRWLARRLCRLRRACPLLHKLLPQRRLCCWRLGCPGGCCSCDGAMLLVGLGVLHHNRSCCVLWRWGCSAGRPFLLAIPCSWAASGGLC